METFVMILLAVKVALVAEKHYFPYGHEFYANLDWQIVQDNYHNYRP